MAAGCTIIIIDSRPSVRGLILKLLHQILEFIIVTDKVET